MFIHSLVNLPTYRGCFGFRFHLYQVRAMIFFNLLCGEHLMCAVWLWHYVCITRSNIFMSVEHVYQQISFKRCGWIMILIHPGANRMVSVPFPVAMRNMFQGGPESWGPDTPRLNIPKWSFLFLFRLSCFYGSVTQPWCFSVALASGAVARGNPATVETWL